MIVKMSKKEYENLKKKYIYNISKNGLITTNAINNKSYLFRTSSDKAFKEYLKVTTATEDFLRLVITEAQGATLTFIEDDITKDEIIEVSDKDILPPNPVPVEDLKEEIKELKEKLKFQGIDLYFDFADYDPMYTNSSSNYDGFKSN